MKEELCKAFCGDLAVRQVPDGLAVRTGFRRPDGDAIGFFVVDDPVYPGLFRLEDDGGTIPFLEACGVDFSTDARKAALQDLLAESGAEFDELESTIRTKPLSKEELPRAAMTFVALLLRSSDFLLLTQERVVSAFKQDAAERLRERLQGRAVIEENMPVSARLPEVIPDMVFRAIGRAPVALFFGTTSQRVNDAIFLQMANALEAHDDLAVVTLLENEGMFSRDLVSRAMNRLASVPVYRRGDEDAAIRRIEEEVLGRHTTLH